MKEMIDSGYNKRGGIEHNNMYREKLIEQLRQTIWVKKETTQRTGSKQRRNNETDKQEKKAKRQLKEFIQAHVLFPTVF